MHTKIKYQEVGFPLLESVARSCFAQGGGWRSSEARTEGLSRAWRLRVQLTGPGQEPTGTSKQLHQMRRAWLSLFLQHSHSMGIEGVLPPLCQPSQVLPGAWGAGGDPACLPQHAATLLCSEKKGIKIISSKPAMHDVFSHCWGSNCLQQRSISLAAHSRARGECCAHTAERNKPHSHH